MVKRCMAGLDVPDSRDPWRFRFIYPDADRSGRDAGRWTGSLAACGRVIGCAIAEITSVGGSPGVGRAGIVCEYPFAAAEVINDSVRLPP